MNTQWLLARTPPGGLPVDDDFRLVETPISSPGANQMLTRTIYLSLDPYQWGRRRSGLEAVGEVCHGRTVSQVVESNLPDYRAGDFVFNTNGWQAYGLTGEGVSVFTYMFPRKIDPALAPISTAVGVLGMLGLTAYAGMVVQCAPKAGETVVVSAASGGVGQIAGQIAKLLGCRVVGIAGAANKCAFVTDVLGFDACVSHKSPDLPEALAAACPDGIDAYFENVGGKVFEAVLPLLNPRSRVSLCGLVSQYGNLSVRRPARGVAQPGAAHVPAPERGGAPACRRQLRGHAPGPVSRRHGGLGSGRADQVQGGLVVGAGASPRGVPGHAGGRQLRQDAGGRRRGPHARRQPEGPAGER